MRLLDRLLATRSPRARGRLAYRLLLSIVVLERPEPAPLRARSSTRAVPHRDR
jgi:hypothetical protein